MVFPRALYLGHCCSHYNINDIPNIVHTNLSFFADDSKVYSVIKTIEDSHQLQVDLGSIHEWCQVWLLKLNLSKCKIMHVGNSPIVTLYALSNGLGQHVQLDKLTMRKIWGSGSLVI